MSFLERRPIRLNGFTLRATSAVAVGHPTPDQWVAAAQFACGTHDASPYWIGSLVEYLKSRDDWRDRRDQMESETGLTIRTMEQYAYVVRNVPADVLEHAPSASHAAKVASLPKADQRAFLKKATAQDWTVGELIKQIKTSKRTKVIEGQAKLEGLYRVWLADPPWSYRANRPTASGAMTRAEKKYPCMSIEEMCKLPVAAHATPDAVMFCWVTAAMLFENPGPREILEAWGFSPRTQYVWDKVLGMPGSYSYVRHELLIVAVRGNCTPDISIEGAHHDSVQAVRREGEHSEKPEHFRVLIDKLYPHGRRVELFGRKRVDNWHCFGNDPRAWA